MTAIAGRNDASGGRLRVGACLSLSGKYARFGQQAALGLEVWQSLDGAVDLTVRDDRSDPQVLAALLPGLAASSDLLLGPYSTQLTRVAGRIAADVDRLLWNHGGSGDDVESAHPGYVVSILTPTSRYAEPYLHKIASEPSAADLWIVHGKGSFGRQVAAGAEQIAHRLGINTARIGPGHGLPGLDPAASWDLLCAGSFEEDVRAVAAARALRHPPRSICAVAAGVHEFGRTVPNPEGIYGVGQWAPHGGHAAVLGPTESEFLAAYKDRAGVTPDYPAVQAVAGAVVAQHCARHAGGTGREGLWSAACTLDTETLFGGFKIDPRTGAQVKHESVLVRWRQDAPVAVRV